MTNETLERALFLPSVELPAIDGLVFRRLRRPVDYSPLNAAGNASRLADGDDFVTTDDVITRFYEYRTDADVDRDVLIVEVGDVIVGYGRTSHSVLDNGLPLYEIVFLLRPEWRGRGIEGSMLQALERRAREVAAELGRPGEGVFGSDAFETGYWRIELLEASGYHPVRWGYRMVRPNLDDVPDAPLPEGLEIRAVLPEHLRAIWEAEVEAFRDHWGARPPVEGDYEFWLANEVETVDPSLWRVAWDGDQVAGMVRGYINEDENVRLGRKRGMVENISVRRPWRRRGLARALIAATIPLLRERGMTEGALGVDAENPSGALRLYERVGFRKESTEITYEKPLTSNAS